MKHISFKSAGYILGTVVSAFLLATLLQAASAWTEPSATPPSANVGAPITTGPAAQTKTGTIAINANDSQYLAGYGAKANKRSIGGAAGWDPETLYVNGWNDWANGVYIGGNANVNDIYIRAMGKWASEMGGGGMGGAIGNLSCVYFPSPFKPYCCRIDSSYGTVSCRSDTGAGGPSLFSAGTKGAYSLSCFGSSSQSNYGGDTYNPAIAYLQCCRSDGVTGLTQCSKLVSADGGAWGLSTGGFRGTTIKNPYSQFSF